MTIIIPAMSIEQQRVDICPSMEHEGIIGKLPMTLFIECFRCWLEWINAPKGHKTYRRKRSSMVNCLNCHRLKAVYFPFRDRSMETEDERRSAAASEQNPCMER